MAKSLLLADDSVTIQRVVELCLGQEDVTVTAAKSVDEALSRARDLRPDLVVADTFMPGKNGYDLAVAVKSDPNLAHIPVLLLASPNEAFDENRARASRADAWIPKPFQSQVLIEQVRKLLTARPVGTQPGPVRPAAAPPAPAPAPMGQRVPTAVPPARVPSPTGAPTVSMKAPAPPAPKAPSAPPPAAPRPAAAAPAPAVAPPARAVGVPPQPGVARPPGVPAAARPPGATPAGAPPIRPGAPAPLRPAAGPGPVAAGRPPGAPVPGAPRPGPAPAPRPPAQQLTAQNHEALLREALTKASREMIEKVVWEVVPELAEAMIKEQLAKLVKQREGQP
jgi:CheY-like chemotaxis protein